MPYHHVDAHAIEDAIGALERQGEIVVSIAHDLADPGFVHVVTRREIAGPQHARVGS